MQNLKVYKEKEVVLIKAIVTGRIFSGDEVKYILTDPKTNKEYKFPYSAKELFATPEEITGKGVKKDGRAAEKS